MKVFLLTLLLLLAACPAWAQGQSGGVRGYVMDQFRQVVVGATVRLAKENGQELKATTSSDKGFAFSGLASGAYSVQVVAPGFSPVTQTVVVDPGRTSQLEIVLEVAIDKQEVSVAADTPIGTEPDRNGDSITLTGKDLSALPDDPDELAAALQALAGPSSGPDGAEIVLDGFTARRLPPKNTIREVRINQNPFSAENDRLGSRGIEIFTKPGTELFRGDAYFNFNDESLNSRNPFAFNRAPFQVRHYGGDVSGPIIKRKASFFLDFERREIDDNAVINATIVDPAFRVVPFGVAVLAPQRLLSINPRIDYQFNSRNTLVARYNFMDLSRENEGVGELSLPSRAIRTSVREHSLQLTETAILGREVFNETRFQLIHRGVEQSGDNSQPTVNVLDAFTGGGASLGLATSGEDRWELNNTTMWRMGQHSLKAGVRLRHVSIADTTTQNFGGTYIFDSGFGPQLNDANQVVPGPLVPITSIESYRRTLLFQNAGLSPEEIRALGGGAAQFSIATGNPLADVSRFDFGTFLQDDWRVRRNFTLSLGLRYENQTNIRSDLNFAPRIRFGWSPGATGKGDPKTVVRGGIGVFYDRFSENLTLQAERYNGSNQQQFIVTNPLLLDSFPNVPPLTLLDDSARRQTVWRVADDLRTPYTIQAALGVDQQLPHKYTLSVTFMNLRTLHALRARNINAPVPETVVPGVPGSGVRPFGNVGNIFQYESSGIINQRMLVVVLNNRFNKRFSVFTRYILASAKSNTDGAANFPGDSYDLSGEYGRAANDVRHRFVLGSSVGVSGGIRLNPFIVATSSRPFNIIIGRDINQDTVFTERPAFATDLTKPGIVTTPFGVLDPNPAPGQPLIPRNCGIGPSFLTVNLRVSKTLDMAKLLHAGGYVPPVQQGSDDEVEETGRYRLTVSVQALNLFNRVNGGRVIGNLGSTMFGLSNSSAGLFGSSDGISAGAGNRRIEASLMFSF